MSSYDESLTQHSDCIVAKTENQFEQKSLEAYKTRHDEKVDSDEENAYKSSPQSPLFEMRSFISSSAKCSQDEKIEKNLNVLIQNMRVPPKK